MSAQHKSGFINILGKPNAGKSTLLNALIGSPLSITNKKAQTTRRRIFGIWNDEDYQLVFSDTPGIIDQPAYKMQERMNSYIFQSFEDADVLLYLADIRDPAPWTEALASMVNRLEVPKILLINKHDLAPAKTIPDIMENWPDNIEWTDKIILSALDLAAVNRLLDQLKTMVPDGPEYYPKEQLSDLNDRFFVSDLIRKQILSLYNQEIPYSCEVHIENFIESTKNGKPFAHINAVIFVSRASQKSIIIGAKGAKIKELGIAARQEIEAYLDHPVFLELFVKIKENWRDDERSLKSFGY